MQIHDWVQDNGFPISAADIKILITIGQNPDMAISDLVHFLGRDKSQITRKIKELEAKDFLQRSPSSKDGRISLLALTPQGHTLVDQIEDHAELVMSEILSPLNAEQQDQLRSLLNAVSGSDS